MLNDSTWKNSRQNTFYMFSKGNILSINGQDPVSYSINSHHDQIELRIASFASYKIEYIDDFTLKLFNKIESFIIMPE